MPRRGRRIMPPPAHPPRYRCPYALRHPPSRGSTTFRSMLRRVFRFTRLAGSTRIGLGVMAPGRRRTGDATGRRGGEHMVTGRVLGDRYRPEQVLGTGGMGAVWRGRDLRLDRPVAIKVLA